MTREEKSIAIEELTAQLAGTNIIYVSDISGLNAETTSDLRRACFKAGIKLEVVKNTLLAKAMPKQTINTSPTQLYNILQELTTFCRSFHNSTTIYTIYTLFYKTNCNFHTTFKHNSTQLYNTFKR